MNKTYYLTYDATLSSKDRITEPNDVKTKQQKRDGSDQ